MISVTLSNLAQKRLAMFDVTFDRVCRIFDLQVQQNETERSPSKLF